MEQNGGIMFEDLDIIISKIQVNYDKICSLWDERCQDKINLKKNMVINVRQNPEIINTIIKYRALLNDVAPEIGFEIYGVMYNNSTVSFRVKTQNSIEYKIDNYIKNHLRGEIPLRKCFNDLMGIRIIIDVGFEHKDVCDFMKKYYKNYKCINSSKNEYIATHIYFEKGNLYFPWELQVWQKNDEENNIKSHSLYKQRYTKWEFENGGGVENG